MTTTLISLSSATRGAALALCASLLAGSAACASAAPYRPAGLSPAEAAQVGAVCHRVMGLPAGLYTQYQACEEGLARAVAGRRSDAALTAARSDCLAKGLKRATPALSACELTALEHPQPPRALLDVSAPATAAPSYFKASADEVRRREQRACAAVGFDPADPGFGACVTGLDSALFDADHPVN